MYELKIALWVYIGICFEQVITYFIIIEWLEKKYDIYLISTFGVLAPFLLLGAYIYSLFYRNKIYKKRKGHDRYVKWKYILFGKEEKKKGILNSD